MPVPPRSAIRPSPTQHNPPWAGWRPTRTVPYHLHVEYLGATSAKIVNNSLAQRGGTLLLRPRLPELDRVRAVRREQIVEGVGNTRPHQPATSCVNDFEPLCRLTFRRLQAVCREVAEEHLRSVALLGY